MIVVVPMAGRGSRYSEKGFDTPKPLIEVNGKPMVHWALDSLQDLSISRLIFVALKEHEVEFGVRRLLAGYKGFNTEFIFLEDVTEGQLCTVLAAEVFFKTDEDILIAASDTFVKSSIQRDVELSNGKFDGLISVFDLPGDRWSFARTNALGNVVEVAEKKRISNLASTGLYYFSNAKNFCAIAKKMIASGERTNNEYYVIPLYQKMIDQGMRIGVSHADEVWDMGTPEAKLLFENYLNRK